MRPGMKVVIVCGVLLTIGIGAKFLLLSLEAAFSEATISFVFRQHGGIRGFLGLASAHELAADPDPVVAVFAARSLLNRCDQEGDMLRLLKTENRTNVRSPILQSLARCKSQSAIPLFREALRSDSVELVAVGAQSLGRLNAREAIPDLEEIVNKDTPRTDAVAAFALAKMGERQSSYPWAVRALLAPKPPQLSNPIDSLKRYYAMKVLEEIGDGSDLKYLEMNKDYMGMDVEFLAAERTLRDRVPKK